jgi:uncharacterized membrane protein
LALAAALSYGIGDFLAGVGGRRSLPALIPLIIQATGVVFAGVAVLLLARGSPTAGVLVWGALSGIGSGLGNWALVRGLALGQMSVVAPVSAVLTAALPVLVGVMLGEHLSGSAWTGIALAEPAIAWCLNLARSPALPGPTWLTVPSPGSASACCSSPSTGPAPTPALGLCCPVRSSPSPSLPPPLSRQSFRPDGTAVSHGGRPWLGALRPRSSAVPPIRSSYLPPGPALSP